MDAEHPQDAPRYGTRPRVVIPLAAGLAALGGLIGMTHQNVLAVDFPTATSNYRVYSDQLQGSSVAAYAGEQAVSDGSTEGTVHMAVASAKLSGLCIIAAQDLPTLGTVSVVLTAGEPVDGKPSNAPPITLDQLEVAAERVTGEGSGFDELQLGRAAETLRAGDQAWRGTPGTGGIQARNLTLTAKQIQAAGLRVGSPLDLPGLRTTTVLGDAGAGESGIPEVCS